MSNTINASHVPRREGTCLRSFGRRLLHLLGWRINGELPDHPRLVVIVAPHTSNWDFFIALATRFAMGLEVTWLGKHTLFLGPWAPLLRQLGGIPVNRKAPQGLLPELIMRLNSRNRFLVALAPEGTRRKVARWKSGFHVIARQTDALIVPVALDYGRKEVRFGLPLQPSEDIKADMGLLRTFYAGVTPRNPENYERNFERI